MKTCSTFIVFAWVDEYHCYYYYYTWTMLFVVLGFCFSILSGFEMYIFMAHLHFLWTDTSIFLYCLFVDTKNLELLSQFLAHFKQRWAGLTATAGRWHLQSLSLGRHNDTGNWILKCLFGTLFPLMEKRILGSFELIIVPAGKDHWLYENSRARLHFPAFPAVQHGHVTGP